MPNQITVTLPAGPGLTATARVLSNVTDVNFRLRAGGMDKMVLEVHTESPKQIAEFDFDAAATVTYTISGQNSTIVVSS